MELENYEIFKESTVDILTKNIVPHYTLLSDIQHSILSGNFFSFHYKIWRANLLSNSEKYDIVVRCRTDLFPLDINFEINDMLNLPCGTVFNTEFEGCLGKCDFFAYANPTIMNYYSSIFLYLNLYLTEGYYFHVPENLLLAHFTKKRIKIREMPLSIYAWFDREHKLHRAVDFDHNQYAEYFSDEYLINLDPNLSFFNKTKEI